MNEYAGERDRLKAELSASHSDYRRAVADRERGEERLRIEFSHCDSLGKRVTQLEKLLEQQTALNVDLQVANEELIRERDQAIRDRITVAERRNDCQEARRLDDAHYRQAIADLRDLHLTQQHEIERLRAELECGGPHSADEIHRMEEVHQDETDAYQAEIADWKRRYVWAKSEFDRLILERRVESGTA
jgi:hypothetical protein